MNKLLQCILLLVCLLNATHATNSDTPPKLTFSLIKNNIKLGNYTAEIRLENLTHSGRWQLAFNSSREVLSVENAQLMDQKQGGDFHLIQIDVPDNQNQLTLQITGRFSVDKYTDAPSGYFLIDSSSEQIITLHADTQLPPWQPAPGEDENTKSREKINTSIEGNPVETFLTVETSLITPLPVELERRNGYFTLTKKTVIFYDKEAKNSAHFLAQSMQPAMGFLLESQENNNSSTANSIVFTTEGTASLTDEKSAEGYILEATPSQIIIRARSEKGFFYGTQSLRQLLPPQIYSQTIQLNTTWKVPSVYIFDYPRFEYRGVMLDVARNFRSVAEIKRLIDLMAIHKLNYFQWHLTDDEGWRIEIKKYPQLTSTGAWRGYSSTNSGQLALMPAYGSGPRMYGGFYTQQEIREIVQYAAKRHITIIPEIDMPGHARAMIVSLATEVLDSQDLSQYTSVQGYHDNVLSPCNQKTFQIIDDILTEIADLFPGQYINVGGDEVPKGAWEKSCMAEKYDPKNPKFTELVQNDFMQQVQTIIQRKGKWMAGWEEIAGENNSLPPPLRAYVWNTAKIDQTYRNAVNRGFEVIMSPAENLYFDLAYNADPKEPGQYWAGYVDTFSVYSFMPIDTMKGQNEVVIKGIQGQLWSEMINSSERLDYLAFPKMSALSELGWSLSSRRNWQNFSDRMCKKHLERLDYYGVLYRKNEFICF